MKEVTLRIEPTASAQPIDMLGTEKDMGFSHMELVRCPNAEGEQFPLPWDAVVDVEGMCLVIQGSAGPCGWGDVKIRLMLKDWLEMPVRRKPFTIMVTGPLALFVALEQHGWEVMT